ncbi:MAG: right-handed parallel beta-helix repeat-containing protein [Sinimarinibacterium sp.]|jgi:parallel beta-helix repeat protein
MQYQKAIRTPSRAIVKIVSLGTLLGLLAPAADAATFRHATSSNSIYVESGGTATLSDIKAALPNAPLDVVDAAARVWLLRANLILRDGATLVLHGADAGGDVNELRLLSDNKSGGFIFVSAEYGNLHIDRTAITSWDSAANGPDTAYGSFGRAYIRVRSMFASDGVTPLESRMDVIDSDVGYLGYNAAESYGLVWKVIGSAPDLYARVNVYGDILNSRVHHNYFGVYTYGHQDGMWLDNEVDHNIKYGFDPHDDSDDLLIEGNDVHDNGNHGIIASQRCDHVVIRNNRAWSNVGNGIMLHRSSDDGLIEDNETYLNTDSGVALFAVKRALVRNNTMLDNGKYGIRLSMGTADSRIERNEIADAGSYGIYFYRGSDVPEPGDDGRNKRNQFWYNTVRNSGSSAIKMSDSDSTVFAGNTFSANYPTMLFANSRDSRFTNNQGADDVEFRISGSSSIPVVARFDRQSRVKVKLDDYSTARFTDVSNGIFDPDEPVYTQANAGGGSVMQLTKAQIGTVSTVYRRNLQVTPSSGSVQVIPTTWNLSGDRRKAWNAQPSSAAAQLAFAVGDLVAGTSYAVLQDGSPVGSFTADAAGFIAFSLVPGSTGLLNYVVQPD